MQRKFLDTSSLLLITVTGNRMNATSNSLKKPRTSNDVLNAFPKSHPGDHHSNSEFSNEVLNLMENRNGHILISPFL